MVMAEQGTCSECICPTNVLQLKEGRKERRKEGRREPEGEREKEGRRENEGESERERESARLNMP